MKTIYDLFHEVEWDAVKEALLKYYPDYESSLVGFENAFREILKMEPKKIGDTNYYVVVEKVKTDEEEWYDVSGRKDGNDERYSLVFATWDEWLGFYVDEESLLLITKEEYIAHVLWEMTYYGFDSETVKEQIDYRIGYITGSIYRNLDTSVSNNT